MCILLQRIILCLFLMERTWKVGYAVWYTSSQWVTVKCVKLNHFFPPLPPPPHSTFHYSQKKKRFPEILPGPTFSCCFECHIVWACMGEETLNDVECFMTPCFCVNPSQCCSETLIGEPHLALPDQTAEE